jgi:hypothetical protein
MGHFKEGDKIIAKHKKNSEELFFTLDKTVEPEEQDIQEKKKA